MIGTCFVPKGIINPDVIYIEEIGDIVYIIFKNQIKEIKYKLKKDSKNPMLNARYVLHRIRKKLKMSPPALKGWIDLRLSLFGYIEDTEDTTDDDIPDDTIEAEDLTSLKAEVNSQIQEILNQDPDWVPNGFTKQTV